jgi:hypothetical protein
MSQLPMLIDEWTRVMFWSCKRCGGRRTWSSGGAHDLSVELNCSSKTLRLLCDWDHALRAKEWPNLLETAQRCHNVGEAAHRAVHASSADLRRFHIEYTVYPTASASRLLEEAMKAELLLFEQVLSLSPTWVRDEWGPRYVALNPALAARCAQMGLRHYL